jgi:hypothetical protein
MDTRCLQPRFKTLSECDHTKETKTYKSEILFNRFHYKLKSNYEMGHDFENCHIIRNYPIMREYRSLHITHQEEGINTCEYYQAMHQRREPKVDLV